MLTRVEVARAAVHAAAVTVDEPRATTTPRPWRPRRPDRGGAGRAPGHGKACIQVHGGMGFTWEVDAHLFLKRAMVLDVALAPTEAALDHLAAAL